MDDTRQMNRWRLILGKMAKNQLSFSGQNAAENGVSCMELEDVLDFLYSREYGEAVRREGEPVRAVLRLRSGLRRSAGCFRGKP